MPGCSSWGSRAGGGQATGGAEEGSRERTDGAQVPVGKGWFLLSLSNEVQLSIQQTKLQKAILQIINVRKCEILICMCVYS